MAGRKLVGAGIALAMFLSAITASGADMAGEAWETYADPDVGFSLSYPPDLLALGGRPEEETVPSQEFEWQFPDGEEGEDRSIFLGFYDWPPEDTLEEWLESMGPGTIETVELDKTADLAALMRVAMDNWAYTRAVYIPTRDDKFVIELALGIQIAKRGTEGGIDAVEAEYATEIAVFDTMAKSFVFDAGQ